MSDDATPVRFTTTVELGGRTATGFVVPHRREWVRWITEAKQPETRSARLVRTVQALADGRKTR